MRQNHPKVAVSYNNIALVYYAQGDYAKSLEFNLKTLSIRESLYGENHPDVAKSYEKIGDTYEKMGDEAKAKEYRQKALSIKENLEK